MKKFLLILTLGALTALYGCAEDDEESNALTRPDPANPASLVGTYDITYYGLHDEGFWISSECTKGSPIKPEFNGQPVECKKATDTLYKKAYIQQFFDAQGNEKYSITAQLQLFTPDMKADGSPINNSFYYHILAAVGKHHFNQGFQGGDTTSKATVRGLESFFIFPAYGNNDEKNRNVTINEVKMDDNGMLRIVVQSRDDKHTYALELKKLSNDSGNHVTLKDAGPQGGIYAVSDLKNKLPVTKGKGNVLYETLIKKFKIYSDK